MSNEKVKTSELPSGTFAANDYVVGIKYVLGLPETTKFPFADFVATTVYGFDNYIEVAVSSAEILTLGSVPVSLLAAAGAGLYYDCKVIIEFTPGGSLYTFNNDFVTLNLSNTYIVNINRTLIIGNSELSVSISDFAINSPDTINGLVRRDPMAIGSFLQLTTFNGTDPTVGDGTILVKIYYNVRTFGTEI